MSIASELTALEGYIDDAYNAVSAKGGILPANKNMSSLSAAIGSISGGGAVSYGLPRTKSADGTTLSAADSGYTYTTPSGITTIGAKALQCAFYGDENIGHADLSAITAFSGTYCLDSAFESSTLASVDLSSLTNGGSGFGLHKAFCNCTNLTTITVGASTGVSGPSRFFMHGCSGCTSLTTATINVKTMYQNCCAYAFENCTSLTSVSFPVFGVLPTTHKNNVMSGMLTGCSNVTVHFPAAMQSSISTISDLTFGGTNTTVLYDL